MGVEIIIIRGEILGIGITIGILDKYNDKIDNMGGK